MSLGVTQNGNLYEKTHSGTVVGATVGGAAGLHYSYKYLPEIKQFCTETINSISTTQITDIFDKGAGILKGEKGTADTIKLEHLNKIVKKGLTFVKNHPLGVGIAVGAAAGAALIGTFWNGIANAISANRMDKVAEQKALQNN